MKFLKASFQGWIYCRDHQAACVKIVLDNGPTLGAGHQAWQMNEINALVWPNPTRHRRRPEGRRRADGGDRPEVRRDQEPAVGRDELPLRRAKALAQLKAGRRQHDRRELEEARASRSRPGEVGSAGSAGPPQRSAAAGPFALRCASGLRHAADDTSRSPAAGRALCALANAVANGSNGVSCVQDVPCAGSASVLRYASTAASMQADSPP